MGLERIIQYVSYVLIATGALAFVVSIITQVIKELPFLKGLPTAVVVMMLSLVICPVSLLAVCEIYKVPIAWYMIFAAVLIAFLVALVAMSGWERIKGTWDKTKYNKKEEV